MLFHYSVMLIQTVDTWRTEWSTGSALTDVQIARMTLKKYTTLVFSDRVPGKRIKLMLYCSSNFHIDVWTPDVTTFKIKLVDFGADGAMQEGDDKSFEISLH
jgi:hypothetical protein